MIVAGALNFGGPARCRRDGTTRRTSFNDTLTARSGRHSIKFGGEYRHFLNDNFAEGTGLFNFPSVAAFLAGTANAFNITLGERRSLIDQRAVGVVRAGPDRRPRPLTLDLGLRYEWHVTPTERDNQFVVFDARDARRSSRVGVDVDEIYRQNNRNFEPRARRGVEARRPTAARCARRLRAGRRPAGHDGGQGHGRQSAVRDAADGDRRRFRSRSAVDATQPAGLAPATDRSATSGTRRCSRGTSTCSGSSARDLAVTRRLSRLARQRPAHLAQHQSAGERRSSRSPPLSASSPILPGAPLGNITQVESTGFSSYHGAWVSVTKRLSRGLQFDTSYTLVEVARHQLAQFVGLRRSERLRHSRPSTACRTSTRGTDSSLSATYELPFTGHALTRGWQVATIVQAQSGNPVNIVTSNAASTACRTPCVRMSSGRSASSARWTSGSIRRRSRPSTASAIWAGTSSSARPSTTPICRS